MNEDFKALGTQKNSPIQKKNIAGKSNRVGDNIFCYILVSHI